MVMLHVIIAIKLEVVIHLLPKGRTARFSRCIFPERNIRGRSNAAYDIQVISRWLSHIRRYFVNGKALWGLSYQKSELRRIAAIAIGNCHSSDDVSFNSCTEMSLYPLMLFLLTMLCAVVGVKCGCAKSSRIHREIILQSSNGQGE